MMPSKTDAVLLVSLLVVVQVNIAPYVCRYGATLIYFSDNVRYTEGNVYGHVSWPSLLTALL